MHTLLVEKINHQFRKKTQSRNQNSGLTICLRMIAQAVKEVGHIAVDSFQELEMAINMYRPTKVLVQSVWISNEEMRVLSLRYPHIHFFIHVHSNIPFLACEAYAFQRFVEAEQHGWGIVFNDYRSIHSVKHGIYLPNIYTHNVLPIVSKAPGSTFNVICGGSLRPMKNHVTQALAAIMYANVNHKDLRFHINASRSEGGESIGAALGGLFALHPRHKLVPISWMDHTEFINYCSTMHLGMQVSLSESFNIVAADYVAAGIPMVVSSEISWGGAAICKDSGDPVSIVNTMHRMLNNPYDVYGCRDNLSEHNRMAVDQWNKFNEA